MTKPVAIFAAIVGFALLIVAVIYFVTPASSLPTFFPGYTAGLFTHHYKHGLGALLLGLGCLAFAWFQSGKKSTNKE